MKRIATAVLFVGALVGGAFVLAACQCPFHSAMSCSSHSAHATAAESPANQAAAKPAGGGKAVNEAPSAETPLPFTGNAKCPIMGNKTNPNLFVEYNDPKTHTYAKIYLCCPGCTAAAKKDLAAAYRKAYVEREL